MTAGPVATITVLPANATVAKGSNTQYTATAKDADGNVVVATITWVTGATGGGNTSNSGSFHASNVGVWPAQIKATTGTGPTLITGSTGVTITP